MNKSIVFAIVGSVCYIISALSAPMWSNKVGLFLVAIANVLFMLK